MGSAHTPDLWRRKSVNIELGIGRLVLKGQYVKCLSARRLSGVKCCCKSKLMLWLSLAWLSLLDNIQNILQIKTNKKNVSGLSAQMHAFYKATTSIKGKLH